MKYTPFWGCMIPIKYPQMELAVRRTVPALGMELVDVEGFTCCPDPIYYKAKDSFKWLVAAARNLAVAEEHGREVLTMCSGCTATLREAKYLLDEDPELRDKVNQRLAKVGKEYKGTVKVNHAVTAIRDEIGMERVAESVTRPLKGLKVAIHYGCHLLKPSQIMSVDDADYPRLLEDMVRAMGAEPVTHREKLLCCGKGCLDPDVPLEMVHDIFASIEESGADCMGLICPTCFSSFDTGQMIVARKKGREFNIPVIYVFQLLGLAQGLTAEDVGLHLHRVPPTKVMEKINSSKPVSERR